MSDTLFVRPYVISKNAVGLCNQLYFLINSILYSSQRNINKIIVSDFISDNILLTKIHVMNLINIQKTNEFLKKYNVMIIDYTTSNTKHNFIEYGGGISYTLGSFSYGITGSNWDGITYVTPSITFNF